MIKIVINQCHGGFGLSIKAAQTLIEMGLDPKYLCAPYNNTVNIKYTLSRDNEFLVRVVEELGEEASAPFAQLNIIEIPKGVEWQIEEYDGKEWVSEKHRTWGL